MSGLLGFFVSGSRVAHLPGWVTGGDVWWKSACGKFDHYSSDQAERLTYFTMGEDTGNSLRLCSRCRTVATARLEWWTEILEAWAAATLEGRP
jgi:hypothetical protein